MDDSGKFSLSENRLFAGIHGRLAEVRSAPFTLRHEG